MVMGTPCPFLILLRVIDLQIENLQHQICTRRRISIMFLVLRISRFRRCRIWRFIPLKLCAGSAYTDLNKRMTIYYIRNVDVKNICQIFFANLDSVYKWWLELQYQRLNARAKVSLPFSRLRTSGRNRLFRFYVGFFHFFCKETLSGILKWNKKLWFLEKFLKMGIKVIDRFVIFSWLKII